MKRLFIILASGSAFLMVAGCNNASDKATQIPIKQEISTATSVVGKIQSAPILTTYTNAKWGFEVGYPTGYEVKTDIEKPTELDLSIRKTDDQEWVKNSDGVCANCAFRLQVLSKFIGGSKSADFKTPEDWIAFQKSIGLSFSQETLNGKTTYTMTDLALGRKTYLVFVGNGAMYDRYDISIKGNDSNADTILQSFKIISALQSN